MTQMTPDEKRFRAMFLNGTVVRKGDKFIRRTGRAAHAAHAEAFRKLVAALGGNSVTTNNTIVATLPPKVAEIVTLPKRAGNAGRPALAVKREAWGSSFDPETLRLIKEMSEKLEIHLNHLVDLAVKQMAEREGII